MEIPVENELSLDRDLFGSTTRRFLEDRAPVAAARALFDQASAFDRETWRMGCELGWTAMLVPEHLGGGSVTQEGLLDLVTVAHELGRAMYSGPFIPSNVVALTLAEHGGPDRSEILGDIVSGDCISTWCVAGPDGTWLAQNASIQARQDRGDYAITGKAYFVQDAAAADLLLVTARIRRDVVQFILPAGMDGVAVVPYATLDLARRLGEVRFDNVRVPADAVLVAGKDAEDAVERQLQVALILQCAETVGMTERVLEFTLEYAKDRFAFGWPIWLVSGS